MPTPKEFSLEVITPDKPGEPHEAGEPYVPPQVEDLPTEIIERESLCACKAGDDNPW